MLIERARKYTEKDIEKLMRQSEFRPTTYRSGRDGHSFTQHIGITNAELMQRVQELYGKAQGGHLEIVTAFCTNQEAFKAGMNVLNSSVGQEGLKALNKACHDQRLVITCQINEEIRYRYVSGECVRIGFWPWFRMILDKNHIAPYGIHLQTFFTYVNHECREKFTLQK